jgi:hypothetical protein
VYEYLIPPGLMKRNSTLEVSLKCTFSAFATAVTRSLRLYLGSAMMASVNNGGNTNLVTTSWDGVEITNRNSTGSQLGEASGTSGSAAQTASVSFSTSTADLTKYSVLQVRGFTVTKGTGTLVNYLNEVKVTLHRGIN